jgi:hypothetical protein
LNFRIRWNISLQGGGNFTSIYFHKKTRGGGPLAGLRYYSGSNSISFIFTRKYRPLPFLPGYGIVENSFMVQWNKFFSNLFIYRGASQY